MEKLGQEPAFPVAHEWYKDGQHGTAVQFGMSKRFLAACFAMQGMLSGKGFLHPEVVAMDSFKYADELLKRESL
jgi:hypothetical protein